MTLEQNIDNLQKQIDDLKKDKSSKKTLFTTDVIINPLDRLKQLKIEAGTTGSARVRRIPLMPDPNLRTTIVGNFDGFLHHELTTGGDTKVYYLIIVIPTDSVSGGVWRLAYTASNAGTSGNVYWTVRVDTITAIVKDTATAEVSLLTDTTAVAVNGVANTLVTRNVNFTIQPNLNTSLVVSIQRTGADALDTNTSTTSLWNAWIEYLAHS